MIFKQVKEIITGVKTQTRRVKKYYSPHAIGNEILVDDSEHEMGNIVNGVKTICSVYSNGRLKWQVGRKYAVVPKRGMPQVYYRDWQPHHLKDTDERKELHLAHTHNMPHFEPVRKEITQLDFAKKQCGDEWKEYLVKCGYQPLYIEITNIRCEPLQDITEADAIAEGCTGLWNAIDGWNTWDTPNTVIGRSPIDEYKDLWESINTQKGTRWIDNPDVWALDFEVVKNG